MLSRVASVKGHRKVQTSVSGGPEGGGKGRPSMSFDRRGGFHGEEVRHSSARRGLALESRQEERQCDGRPAAEHHDTS